MKKVPTVLIRMIVLLAILVAGCGQNATTDNQQNQATNNAQSQSQAAGNPQNSAEKAEEGSQNKVTTIRFGHTTVPSMLAVAKEQGWLEEEFKNDGIKIEYEKFLAGPPLIEAFAGGRLDFGQVGDQPAIQARANNIPIKAIGVYSSGSKSIGLVIPTGSQITSFKELKGKKVGVTVGSVGHRLLYAYLKENGMSPGDIQQINLSPADIKLAIEQKNIDAAVTYEPWISTIEQKKLGRQIDDATGILNSYSVYIVSESFAKEHPDIVKRVLKVLDKAEKWSRENPEKAIEYMSNMFGTDKEILAQSTSRINYDIRFTEDAIQSIKDTAAALRESNVIRKDVNVDELIDTSFLESIGVQ